MRPIAFLLLALLAAHQMGAQSANQDPPQPANAPSATAKGQPDQPASTTAAPTKGAPPNRSHKVYTNEDFDTRPRELDLHGTRDLLAQVNICDQNCLDDVSRRVGTPARSHGEWKQVLLRAVDTVKEDLAWQNLLREGLAIQVESCELQLQKQQAFRSSNQPESAWQREYEGKFSEIARRMGDVKKRGSLRIAARATEPYKSQFMQLQMDRVAQADCNITVSQPQDSDDGDPDQDPQQLVESARENIQK